MKGTRYFVILSEAKDLCTCSGTMHRSFASLRMTSLTSGRKLWETNTTQAELSASFFSNRSSSNRFGCAAWRGPA
jgi:hypothetical protein